MNKITPFLWFDDNAEEAMNFYVSVFKNSKIITASRHPETGQLFAATFELDGQQFMALNAGPSFTFNEAVSFFVRCETQQEVDTLWDTLTAEGGEEGRCGWLKDKFGLSWQIVPTVLDELLNHPDPEKAQRAMNAMLQMNKLDIETLKQAAA